MSDWTSYEGPLPPPALGKCDHRGLARRRIAVGWRTVFVMAKGHVHIHDIPTGTAAAFMMRPTTTPSASTAARIARRQRVVPGAGALASGAHHPATGHPGVHATG